jgi:hypothetical protein
MRSVILLLVLGLLPLAGGDPNKPMTKLQIVVKNEEGKPVDRASVIVKFVPGRAKAKFGAKVHTEWELKSSQEGIVNIPEIPQGNILIQVIAANYQTFGQTFDVEEDEKTIEVELKPPQHQYSAH